MEGTVFEAVIVPHRSLGATGTRWVAGTLMGASALVSTILWWLGAWPVIGFNGAEIALALVLLRQNGQAVRRTEMLSLSPDGLTIVRTGPGSRTRERKLDVSWLRASLEERPGRAPILWLASRAQRYEVGAELGEAEKRSLASALQAALLRMRNPVFDNPQLRPS